MNQKLFLNSLSFFLFLLCSCAEKKKEEGEPDSSHHAQPVFTKVAPASSGITFNNVLTETDSINITSYQYLYNGAGVATGDINNDGLADIFFSANTSTCRLFRNDGNFRFTDITESAGVNTTGWCQGVTMADVNNDGYLDIYVCRSSQFEPPENRRNLLFINNGNGSFTEKAKSFGLDNDGYSTHATFFDYNRDGYLDMYLVNHGIVFNFDLEGCARDNSKIDRYKTHRMFRNNGNNSFTDVTKEAGLLCNAFGLSASVGDLDNDGWDDLYVANDYTMPDFVYINNKNGTFTDKRAAMLRHLSNFSMGSDIADFNNDLLADIITLDMLPESNRRQKMLFGAHNYDKHFMMITGGYGEQFMQNCLQLNNGNGSFSEIAELSGVAKTDWSWAPLFADFDNDGWKDLFVTNGYVRDFTDLDFTMYRSEEIRRQGGRRHLGMDMVSKMPSSKLANYVFRNNGDLTFADVSSSWGVSEKTVSTGAAYCDLDNDNDLDLVISNTNDTTLVYRNNTSGNHSLKIRLKGNEKNPFAVGSKVEITAGGITQVQQLIPARGYESSVDYALIFGTGQNTMIEKVKVKWFDGREQQFEKIKSDTAITFFHSNAFSSKPEVLSSRKTIFSKAAATGIRFVHTEDYFVDFKREPLLTHQLSRLGPSMAAADANGDQRDDIFIGGAKNQPAALFLQQVNGSFQPSQQQAFVSDKKFEDMGALFFDADSDGDHDLIVLSGGNAEQGSVSAYEHRLYLNNGKGNFSKAENALPVMETSGSCVVAGDYDGDDDLDLFIGGRLVPGHYPRIPRSYLLNNNNGKFTDATKDVSPGLEYAGMVTTALWTDFNSDHNADLVIAGEWMPVTFFENTSGKLRNILNGSGLEQSSGWWNSITGADFDHDGDIDYVAGNAGFNSKIKATISHPASIIYSDFDKNGTTDAVLSYYHSDGRSYPWCSRDDFIDQMRPMKKRFLRYADFAGKTIHEIFSADELKAASTLFAQTFASGYIENTGKGKFRITPLPLPAQCSPVFGLLTGDFDEDGNTDLLLTGNYHPQNVNIGRNDAGNGLLLRGDGTGKLVPVPFSESGFYTPGDARSMISVYNNAAQSLHILVANNANWIQAFEWKPKNKNMFLFKAGKGDSGINWEEKNGKKNFSEIYCGSGYLSQSSNTFLLPAGSKNVSVTGSGGKQRMVNR